MIFWTAFIVGLIGGFHCIGMCGPIALALPVSEGSTARIIINRFLYNAGRVITYALIGAIVGMIGQGLSLAFAQQWISIATGIVLILILLIPKSLSNSFNNLPVFQKINNFIKRTLGLLFRKKTNASFLLIGILNGFLPCGLVYVALAGALASGSLIDGILYMTAFGLGTIPIMLAVSLFGQFIGLQVRQKINRLIPVFVFILAILFILRGMNLGIKFISPRLNKTAQTEQTPECH